MFLAPSVFIQLLLSGVDQYVIGSPLFKKVTLSLQNGKKFVISAPNNTRDNVYINAASLNGQNWNNSYIDFDSIQAGGKIEFEMSAQPNLNWAGKKDHVPFSLSNLKLTPFNLVYHSVWRLKNFNPIIDP